MFKSLSGSAIALAVGIISVPLLLSTVISPVVQAGCYEPELLERMCRRRWGGSVQVRAAAVLPWFHCNKYLLQLELARRQKTHLLKHVYTCSCIAVCLRTSRQSLSFEFSSFKITDPEQTQFSRYVLRTVYPSLVLKKLIAHLAGEQFFVYQFWGLHPSKSYVVQA